MLDAHERLNEITHKLDLLVSDTEHIKKAIDKHDAFLFGDGTEEKPGVVISLALLKESHKKADHAKGAAIVAIITAAVGTGWSFLTGLINSHK